MPTKGKTYKGGMQAYVKNMMEIGKVTKYLKGVGYLRIAVDVIDGGIKVYNAASEEKTRTTVVEGAKIGVGIATGAMTTALVVGLAPGGTGLVVIGIVALSAVVAGKATTNLAGEGAGYVYDLFKNNGSK